MLLHFKDQKMNAFVMFTKARYRTLLLVFLKQGIITGYSLLVWVL